MKTFPKCEDLQESACNALVNLASCEIGTAKAIESGGIEVLLAAVNNHLDSELVCENACWELVNLMRGRKENTDRLIILDGDAAVEKVRIKWPDNKDVQTQVERLACIFGAAYRYRARNRRKRRLGLIGSK
jgi:hypothetical protein